MLCHDYDHIFQEGSERICAEFKGQVRKCVPILGCLG